MLSMDTMRRRAFTLVEVLIALSGFLVLVLIVRSIYQWLFRVRSELIARKFVVEKTYYTLEKIHMMLDDFTIDYEEYRNRNIVWCRTNSQDILLYWYCNSMTHYGNQNPFWWAHQLYYCNDNTSQTQVVPWATDIPTNLWCSTILWPQSFGQYAEQFWNRGMDISGDGTIVGDADDRDRWSWPSVMVGENWPTELYLISPDQTQRLFIRRVLVETGTDQDRYTLQILRLQGLDAGSNHDFALWDPTVYDWKIDTRACDAAQWFFCSWPAVGGVYTGYNLPIDAYDGRVDILDERLTVLGRKLEVYPTKNPDYARAEPSTHIQPYIRIFIETALYIPAWWFFMSDYISDYRFQLQTTFNTRTWYTK
jgi:hypothetical protein